MAWQDALLEASEKTSSNEFIGALDKLISRLEESASSLRAVTSDASLLDTPKVSAAISKARTIADGNAVDGLIRLSPLVLRKELKVVCSGLVQSAQAFEADRTSQPHLNHALTAFESEIGRLTRVRHTAAVHQSRLRLARQALILGASLVVAVAGLWINYRHGLRAHSHVVSFPRGPYSQPPAGCSLTTAPEDLNEHLSDLSELYFRGTGRFPYRFWENPPPADTLGAQHDPLFKKTYSPSARTDAITRAPVWELDSRPHICRVRTTLENISLWNTEPISSVTVNTRLVQLVRFPWHRLEDSPKVECRYRDTAGELTILNKGLGPITELRCSLNTDQAKNLVVVFPGEAFTLSPARTNGVTEPIKVRAQDLFYKEPSCAAGNNEGFYPALVDKDTDGNWELRSPIQYTEHLKDGATITRQAKTLASLYEIAEVVQGGRGYLNIEYSSVKGQAYSHRIDVDLLPFIVYYRFKPESRFGKHSCAAPAGDALFFLAAAISAPKTQADGGETLITLFSKTDLKNVRLGESREETQAVDKRLAARGVINWQFEFSEPANGIYEVTLKVNDVLVDSFRVFFFRPERLEFKPWDIEKIRREMKAE